MNNVSIILRCKNEEEHIRETLDAIFSQRGDVRSEVVVVDSGSTDRTLEFAQRYPAKLLKIPAEKFSYGYALNYGIERSQAEVICNLSAHCVPQNSSWLSELLEPILTGCADATYGRQIPVKGINAWEEYQLNRLFPRELVHSDRVAFSNAHCAFRRALWVERKFDETIPRWEDYLWYALLKHRYRFRYCPNAVVIHSHRFRWRSYAEMCYRDGMAAQWSFTRYGIDLGGVCRLAFNDKVVLILKSLAAHAAFFLKSGYFKECVGIPAVPLCGYAAYALGYFAGRIPFPRATE